jgi:hypothetical protein
MNLMLTGVALAMLAAAPALAQCPTCGILILNGLTGNTLTANALTNNILTLNALSVNSAGELGRVVAVELPRR